MGFRMDELWPPGPLAWGYVDSGVIQMRPENQGLLGNMAGNDGQKWWDVTEHDKKIVKIC